MRGITKYPEKFTRKDYRKYSEDNVIKLAANCLKRLDSFYGV